ncbi:hypothetical protein D3C71_1787310 [compost metagenome]
MPMNGCAKPAANELCPCSTGLTCARTGLAMKTKAAAEKLASFFIADSPYSGYRSVQNEPNMLPSMKIATSEINTPTITVMNMSP